MTRSSIPWILALGLIGVCVVPAAAQTTVPADAPTGEAPTGEAPADVGPLREAMLEYFVNGLRENVGLTDPQMAAVLPIVRAMERERSVHRRQRADLMRRLRSAYRGGGTDDQLQSLLDEFEAADDAARDRQRVYQERVDDELTVRQRIQFRFYTQRFRRRMEQRIREISGGTSGARPRDRFRRTRPDRR